MLMIVSIIVIAIIVIALCCYRQENFIEPRPRRQGYTSAATNKTNSSWYRYMYNDPPFGQTFKKNDEFYKAWDTYWKQVDAGLAEPITDPMAYYALPVKYS